MMARITGIEYSRDELIGIMNLLHDAVSYWGKSHNRMLAADGRAESIGIIEHERSRELVLTTRDLQDAINKIVSGGVQINEEIRRLIASGDVGMIDILAADCIAQVACFGKLVYG
jgi:hypothetical protein